MKQRIKNLLLRIYAVFCRIVFGYKNAVVFVSFSGKSYSDNTRAVSEKLHELFPSIGIVWFFSNVEEKKAIVPKYVKCIDGNNKFLTMKWLSIAKCVVNNCTLSDCGKGSKQYFVQVWHGDRAFKKILYDSSFATEDFELAEAKEGFCDLAVAGSAYGEMQYRSAFRYKGQILKVGIPRNDMLIQNDPERSTEIKRNLKISEHQKIVLYAPTLRRSSVANKELQLKQDIDLEEVLEELHKKDDKEWIMLVRSHPATIGLCGFKENESIRDVSTYEDMADLLLISDFLITDYSSSAGDFALLHRPIILFQSDRKEYLEKDRDFYFEMEDSPYFIAENQEELVFLIKTITAEQYSENCDDILKFYDTCESGKASEMVAKKINQWICEGERE